MVLKEKGYDNLLQALENLLPEKEYLQLREQREKLQQSLSQLSTSQKLLQEQLVHNVSLSSEDFFLNKPFNFGLINFVIQFILFFF